MELKTWLEGERGRVTRLAAALKVSQPTVSDWSAGKKRIPLDHCPFIQVFTEGSCTCEELRPDRASYFAQIRDLAANDATHPEPTTEQEAV
jgi:DNA-binding transcriptional regulator YdaS (Cro superfamily)